MKTSQRLIVLAGLSSFFVASLFLYPPPEPSDASGAPPAANDDILTLPTETSPASAAVTSNDTDPDGDLDPLTVAVTETPATGVTRVGLDGSILYQPGTGFTGADRLQYQVCDSQGKCARAELTVALRSVEPSGSTVRFAVFGDYGDNSEGAARVASLVERLDPDFIVTTGDNSYDVPDYDLNIGQLYSDYIGSYRGGHGDGAATNRFFPALGDHEYSDGGIEPYLEYFTLPGAGVETSGTSGNERYYDFVMGPVQIFVLNLEPEEPDGTGSRSAQGKWLQAQLTASKAPWRLVVAPTPPFSSGNNHGSDPSVQWPFGQWGVDAVFSGDDHVYERIVRGDVTYLVSGLGGRSLYGFDQPVEGSEARYAEDFGVLLVEACDRTVEFAFHSVTDGIVDRYSLGDGSCPSGGST